jgi:hypothetical protein
VARMVDNVVDVVVDIEGDNLVDTVHDWEENETLLLYFTINFPIFIEKKTEEISPYAVAFIIFFGLSQNTDSI